MHRSQCCGMSRGSFPSCSWLPTRAQDVAGCGRKSRAPRRGGNARPYPPDAPVTEQHQERATAESLRHTAGTLETWGKDLKRLAGPRRELRRVDFRTPAIGIACGLTWAACALSVGCGVAVGMAGAVWIRSVTQTSP